MAGTLSLHIFLILQLRCWWEHDFWAGHGSKLGQTGSGARRPAPPQARRKSSTESEPWGPTPSQDSKRPRSGLRAGRSVGRSAGRAGDWAVGRSAGLVVSTFVRRPMEQTNKDTLKTIRIILRGWHAGMTCSHLASMRDPYDDITRVSVQSASPQRRANPSRSKKPCAGIGCGASSLSHCRHLGAEVKYACPLKYAIDLATVVEFFYVKDPCRSAIVSFCRRRLASSRSSLLLFLLGLPPPPPLLLSFLFFIRMSGLRFRGIGR